MDEDYDAAVSEAEEASKALNDYLKEVGVRVLAAGVCISGFATAVRVHRRRRPARR